MRRILFLTVVILTAVQTWGGAQEGMTKIPSTYDRSSLTLFYLKFPENHADELADVFPKIKFTDKFNNNNLSELIIEAPFNRANVKPQNALKSYLEEKGVGKQIVGLWYNRQDDGMMSMDLIFERGRFNATDAAYLKAQATKRGEAMLKDYGNRLIAKSYILVIDFKSVQTMKEAKVKQLRGWKAAAEGYLFKVEYNEQTQNALYDCWIYPDDTPEVKAEKLKKFQALNIPISYVTKTSVNITSSQPAPDTQLGKLVKQKSMDQLLVELVQKAYDETLYFLEKNFEDFMVKTTIYKVRPIRAKIGKKEGLKCDHRYFAYEYVWDEKTNSVKPKYRGVVRATSKIVDNRQIATGEMPTSKFYQTAGRRLRTGYLLRQQNDNGIEFLIGAESGEVGGAYARIDYRTGRFSGIKALFLYCEGGLQTKEYVGFTEEIAFLHYGAGLAKGFMLTRNIELRPYVGIGQEQANSDEINNLYNDEALTVLYFKAGANVALNLRYNIQLIGGIGSYTFISYAQAGDTDTETAWKDIFKDRQGTSTLIGLKIMF